jgi:8-oxo-dGTP pyrophosphatase MutT (NUDIX family)
MDMGELAKDAALRELEEETGLRHPDDVSPPEFCGVVSSLIDSGPGTEKRQCQTHYFFCMAKDDAEAKLMEPEKCEGWEWLTLPQIEANDEGAFYPGTKWMLLAIFADVKMSVCIREAEVWQRAARKHEELAETYKSLATQRFHVQP